MCLHVYRCWEHKCRSADMFYRLSRSVKIVLLQLSQFRSDWRHCCCCCCCFECLWLTCGAAALVLDVDGFFALCLGCQAGALQGTAAPVRHSVGSAQLVAALTDADSQLVLLVLVAFEALQPGAAAARSRSPPAAQLPLRGGAHRAAAAGVQQRAGTAALHRERSARSRVTWSAAWTRRDTEREHLEYRKEGQNRNQGQKHWERLHGGLMEVRELCWFELRHGLNTLIWSSDRGLFKAAAPPQRPGTDPRPAQSQTCPPSQTCSQSCSQSQICSKPQTCPRSCSQRMEEQWLNYSKKSLLQSEV